MSVFMLNVVMLSVEAVYEVWQQNSKKDNLAVLSAVLLSVASLNVVAPCKVLQFDRLIALLVLPLAYDEEKTC